MKKNQNKLGMMKKALRKPVLNAVLFSSSLILVSLSILFWNPSYTDFCRKRNLRLNGLIKIQRESQLILPNLLVYARGELDKQVYRTAENGLNPSENIKLSFEEWWRVKEHALKQKKVNLNLKMRIYLRPLTSGRPSTTQDEIILCRFPSYGCIHVVGPLYYSLEDRVTGIVKNGSTWVDAVHPVRIFLLYELCGNLIEALNQTLREKYGLTSPERVAGDIVTGIHNNLKQSLRECKERKLEVKIKYSVSVYVKCHVYFSTTVKGKYTTIVRYYSASVNAKVTITDVKEDALVFVDGKIRRITFKKDFSGKAFLGSKTNIYEGDFRGTCGNREVCREGEISFNL